MEPADRKPAISSVDKSSAASSQVVSSVAVAQFAGAAAATQATSAGEIGPQAIATPGGPATSLGLGESFSAQLSTGIASYKIGLTLPAARGLAQPDLALIYSSSGGNGPAGMGWSIGAPSISRQLDRGGARYDDRADWHAEQDRFVFGSAELIPICTVNAGACTGARTGEVMPAWANGWQYFRARIEDNFLRFFWSPNHLTWRIQSKEGLAFELGVPLNDSAYTDALDRNPDRPSEVYRWNLVRQYDSHGVVNTTSPPAPMNPVVYRYLRDGNVAYLSDIFYTPPVTSTTTAALSAYAHHVRITYDARPDATASYRTGWETRYRIRATRVDVASKTFTGSATTARELVRRYHLQYEPSLHSSLLKSVVQEGRCIAAVTEDATQALPASNCPKLPPVTLGYTRVSSTEAPAVDSQGFAFEPIARTEQSIANSPPHSISEERTSFADINADGLPDVLVTAPEQFAGKHGVFLSDPASTALAFTAMKPMGVRGVTGVDATVLGFSNPNVAGLDYDANGVVDLVHMPRARKYSVFKPEVSGSELWWTGREIATASQLDSKIDLAGGRSSRVFDVNGDGLVDVVIATATQYQTFFSLGRYARGDGQFGQGLWTSATEANISNEPVRRCVPNSSGAVLFSDPDVQIADMNGDGLQDVVRMRSGQVLYWPGRGNGVWGTGDRLNCAAGVPASNRHVTMTNAPRFGTTQPGALQLADVNGDGLSDVVEIRSNAIDVYYNDNGTAWTARKLISNTPLTPTGTTVVRLLDINGSGTPDLVWATASDYRFIDLTGGKTPYLLTRIENGLGKVTELEYSSSTELMRAAAVGGQTWNGVMPSALAVVVRSRVRDGLQAVGRPAGEYVTEFSYRDPLFDGRQREFRGFRQSQSTRIGDSTEPTSIERTVFHLGECPAAAGAPDVCSSPERWRDNYREGLKGSPALVETLDANGVYLSTAHPRYKLRQLYAGRDGRRVIAPLATGVDIISYDTASFDRAEKSIPLPDVEVELSEGTSVVSRAITQRATAGAARTRSEVRFDDFGNVLESTKYGCVEGCPEGVDEAITVSSQYERPASDVSGWLYRERYSWISGNSSHPRQRDLRHDYDSAGDRVATYATLQWSEALQRSHASGGAVAPLPTDASGAVDTSRLVQLAAYTLNGFGQRLTTQGPNGRFNEVQYDSAYSEFVTRDTTYAGPLSGTRGSRAISTTGTYDRGLQALVSTTSSTGQPSRYDYDVFGRLTARFLTDPSAPGTLARLASETYEYRLTSDPVGKPFSILVTRVQDGATVATDSYAETWTFIDGLGRSLATLTQADKAAGDQGAWVVGGAIRFSAKGGTYASCLPWFTDVAPSSFSLGTAVPTDCASQARDAFGRVVEARGFNQQTTLVMAYHAMTTDEYDAEDVSPTSPHAGTYLTRTINGHGRTVRVTERLRVGTTLEERHKLTAYTPSGDIERITFRRTGSADVVRWLRYDGLGRLVLNVEPNTSGGFSTTPNTSIKAWRYAYNDAGNLVATSDARGCGSNYHYDAGGRLIGEDYSPCTSQQPAYLAPNLTTGDGLEVYNLYDALDPDSSTIVDAAGVRLDPVASLLWGKLASTSDRGAKVVMRYDARGRSTGVGVRIVKPGVAGNQLSSRYAPRWYVKQTGYDAPGRVVSASTGSTLPGLRGADNASVVTKRYSKRGLVDQVSGSYGVIIAKRTATADGLPETVVMGDSAQTQRAYTYNTMRRLTVAETFRAPPSHWSSPPAGYTPPVGAVTSGPEPTAQLSLEHLEFGYDLAGKLTRITDFRTPEEWPPSARPVSRSFEYDDANRIKKATYEHSGGDSWTSPYAAENAQPTRTPQPSPHVSFTRRVKEQTWTYDWLGNVSASTDDALGFYDRSLGSVSYGSSSSGPHRLVSATNRSSTSTRKGDLSTVYDAAGNLTELIVRRDGACLPAGASCWQRFLYEWDEAGHLSRARRWDLATGTERTANGTIGSALPSRAANVELRYGYATGGERVLKTAIDNAGRELHTVYVFPSLELRGTTWDGAAPTPDYVLNERTTNVRAGVPGVNVRVVHIEESVPTLSSGKRHVLLEFADHLGSNSVVVDKETGELVEHRTYQAYGSTDAGYRPARWAQLREPYGFSGKEEDIEVGLQYYGARYYAPGLNRWISPDPAAIHSLKSDLNPYGFCGGSPQMAVDPDGRLFWFVAAAFAIGAAVNYGMQVYQNHKSGAANPWTQNINVGNVVLAGAIAATSVYVGAGATAWAASVSAGEAGAAGLTVTLTTGQTAAANAFGGMAAGAYAYSLSAPLNGQKVTGSGMAISMITGGALGALGGALGPRHVVNQPTMPGPGSGSALGEGRPGNAVAIADEGVVPAAAADDALAPTAPQPAPVAAEPAMTPPSHQLPPADTQGLPSQIRWGKGNALQGADAETLGLYATKTEALAPKFKTIDGVRGAANAPEEVASIKSIDLSSPSYSRTANAGGNKLRYWGEKLYELQPNEVLRREYSVVKLTPGTQRTLTVYVPKGGTPAQWDSLKRNLLEVESWDSGGFNNQIRVIILEF